MPECCSDESPEAEGYPHTEAECDCRCHAPWYGFRDLGAFMDNLD